jgi:isocitrate lyase
VVREARRRSGRAEDQLSSEKKCGHLGGKVLVGRTSSSKRWLQRSLPTCRTLKIVLAARTDALPATLLTSEVDPADPHS